MACRCVTVSLVLPVIKSATCTSFTALQQFKIKLNGNERLKCFREEMKREKKRREKKRKRKRKEREREKKRKEREYVD